MIQRVLLNVFPSLVFLFAISIGTNAHGVDGQDKNVYEKGFGTRQGSHFFIRFEGAEHTSTAELIAILLEEAYMKVGMDLGFHPIDRIAVVLYAEKSFYDITRTPSWAGALYDGNIKLPSGGITERTKTLEAVLFHEYTHAIVHRLSNGNSPMWLNEGIAQHEEGKGGEEAKDLLRNMAAGGGLPALSSFERSFMRLSEEDAYLAYIVSLSATDYLIREFGIFSVKNIFDALGKGAGLDSAFLSAINLSYVDFEENWHRWLKR
ncbi:MAG: hypothetical protein HY880_00185 [Deltaproteobacteria bacterium]|nr:hypothetical protein [Deltaproteobacteria bacterium]